MNKPLKIITILLLLFFFQKSTAAQVDTLHTKDPLQLAEKLLYNVKTQEPTVEIEKMIAALTKKQLTQSLRNDAAKKSFWLNIYNAAFQLLAAKGNKNPAIFNERLTVVAGISFSLEEIEQGILRKDFKKLKLIKSATPFSKKNIRPFMVDAIDYRIHFALNCGAKSCPPIAFYSYASIDKQLDIATRSFIRNNTTVDDIRKQITVTQLMEWYNNDFGGEEGIRAIIKKVMQKDVTNYSILFSEYNWEEGLRNFTEANK